MNMGKISEIKMQLRHKEWAEMVSECQASGKKVDEWCRENGINVSTYYKRLNVLRTELIEGSEKQSIVPVSVFRLCLGATEQCCFGYRKGAHFRFRKDNNTQGRL